MFKLLLMMCVFAVSYARSPLEIKQDMLGRSMECTHQNSLSSEELQKLLNHDMPGTKNSKCFIACVFKKFGWMDSKGMYDLDNANKFADEEYVGEGDKLESAKKLFDICKTVNEETSADGEAGCDRAESLAKCFMDNAPKLGFSIHLGGETK